MNSRDRKIRVCHLASGDLWAGAEVQVRNICKGLLETSEVEVNAVLMNDGRLAEELRLLGMNVTIFDEQRNSWWGILWKLTNHFLSQHIDVLHTHRYKENILGTLSARIASIPHVMRTVHGTTEIYSGWNRIKARAYRMLDDLVFRYGVNGIVGVSREITESLQRRYHHRIILHVPNCVDEQQLVPRKRREEKRAEIGLKPSDFVIGTVGRLTAIKGTKYLIMAVPEIIRRNGDVRVLVVGDGPLRGELEAIVHAMGLQRTITFLGWRDDSIDIINALDLFVLPSLHEGIPTVLLEAMSLGVPSVVSATGGVREVVTEGRNGLMVRPGNHERLAQQCIRIMVDRTLAEQLVKQARTTITKYYLKQTTPKLLDLYRSLA